MSAAITQVAQAIVDELNTGGFAVPFTAQLVHLPLADVKDLEGLTVRVVPSNITVTLFDRALNQEDYTIDIGVQQKLNQDLADQDTEIATLSGLVQEIAGRFSRTTLDPTGVCATWVSTSYEPWLAVEHLDEFRSFTSIIRLTYRAVR